MKILVFEFITGGGLAKEGLPESLAREGLLMLDRLLNELSNISSVQVTVLLDWRCAKIVLANNIQTIIVSKGQSVYDLLPPLIKEADSVWPIAPEQDFHLERVSKLVLSQKKRLLNSAPEAVVICSDKWLTAQALRNGDVLTVKTRLLDDYSGYNSGQWVIKPRDGMGCINNYLVCNAQEFAKITAQIKQKSGYIIQPYVEGDLLSLSCLFKEGKAWLLCCNRQFISVEQQQFNLKSCEVNISTKSLNDYQTIIDQIAKTIKGLWGYVGVDIIHPTGEPSLVLEINPRLTTSYVGINHATGLNIAKAVISLVDGDPVLQKTQDRLSRVDLSN